MPLWEKGCEWQQGGSIEQQGGLPGLVEYLDKQLPTHYNLQQLRADLAAGWYLASDIPVGYGLGSSAALCVAVFERYATEEGKAALQQQGAKVYFAQLENHFHGTSSGTDPLIISERKVVELGPKGHLEYVSIPQMPGGWQLFLLDTGKARETAPLVNYFTNRYDTDSDFRQATDSIWTPAVDKAIDALQKGEMEELSEAFRAISQFQLKDLPPMVLPELHTTWQAGLDGGSYLLKICGAGGGGFCLGLTQDMGATRKAISEWPLTIIAW